MAISGSFYGTTGNSAIKPKITWTAEKNEARNSSVVTATLFYSRTDNYQTYGYWGGSLTIHGNTKTLSSKYIEITKNSDTVAITHTVDVPHNDDGTMEITISASGSISGTTLTKTNISKVVALENIPRAASIGATDADIGSVSLVTIGKKSDLYTYTVAWKFGSLSGYLTETGMTDTAKYMTVSSLAFALPEAFYYEIPDKTSGSCTLTCTTYLAGTVVGTPQSTSFTVRTDPNRCAPLLTAVVADSEAGLESLTGSKNRFIRSVSTAACTLTAQAQYGASIVQKKIAGQTVKENGLQIKQIATDTIRFSVTDSRGYTTEKVVHLDMVPYFVPVLRLRAGRSDATSGKAVLQIEGSFYSDTFGEKNNGLHLQYRLENAEAVELFPQIDENNFSVQQELENLDYTQAYTVTVTATDETASVTVSTRIQPGIPVFDWGKDSFSFHVPVSLDGNAVKNIALPTESGDAVPLGYVQENLLKNAGSQTLNGSLTLKSYASANGYLLVNGTDNYPRINLRDSAGNTASRIQVNDKTHQLGLYQYCPDKSGYREGFYFPQPGNHTANMEYRIMTSKTHGMVKLWENGSQDSSFPQQTLAINLTDFDGIMICYRNDTAGSVYLNSGFFPKGQSGTLVYVSTSAKQSNRKFTATKDGISFEEGSYQGGSSNNNHIIPIIIYGIKGVS